jgi:hypothetical protein
MVFIRFYVVCQHLVFFDEGLSGEGLDLYRELRRLHRVNPYENYAALALDYVLGLGLFQNLVL